MSSAGGRPSWQAMVSVRTSIVPPGPCPPLEDTPGPSPAATAPQVTASIHDFAVSLRGPPGAPPSGSHQVAQPLHPSGLPLTCNTPVGAGALGLPMSFAP